MRGHLAALTGAALAAALLLPAGVAFAQDDEGLRIEGVDLDAYPQVVVTATVSADADSPDRAGQLRVLEDGEPRDVEATRAASEDLEVVLLIDTTGSMGGGPMEAAKDAAASFVEQLPDDTRVAIVGYDAQATVVTGFSASRDEHLVGIDGLQPEGDTAMYDAVITTLDDVFGAPDERVRQAIVLLTDGEDNASAADLDDVAERLADSEVTLQGVEYLTDFSDEAGIRALAEAAGGRILGADEPEALLDIYDDLAADLVNHYRLVYPSDAVGEVELTVKLDDDGQLRTATRTVEFPTERPPAEPPEEPQDESEPQAVAPAEPPTAQPGVMSRIGLLIGAAAWFVALTLLLIALFAPRERRAQLAGAADRLRARGGPGEIAERITLVADRALERRGYRRGLNSALERAGIDLRAAEFVVLVASAAVAVYAFGLVSSGPLAGLMLAVLPVIGARLLLSFRTSRRQAAFAGQLADTLQLLSGSLRAGYSLMQAIDAVAREADAPTCDEFGRVVLETRLGRDTNDAFEALAARMETGDFTWVMQAIQIHREVGGDLAEVLDTVGDTIRERDQIRRQVQALSAEGRLSAWVLLALPFGVGIIIFFTNRPYLAELTNGGLLGWGLLGLGGLLMTVGVVWMRNLVKLEF